MSDFNTSAEVRMYRDKPAIFINGEPQLPVMYALTHVTSGRNTWEEVPFWSIRHFGRAGVHMHQFDLNLRDVWPSENRIDIALAVRQIRGAAEADPEALVMIRFHVNAPHWWDRKHPCECMAYGDAEAVYPPERMMDSQPILDGNLDAVKVHSPASELWRAEATAAYRRFLEELAATEEGGRVFSIQVADGVYGEWHPFGFLEHDPDTSEPMRRAFSRFLKAKYGTDESLRAAWRDTNVTVDTVSIPGTLEREKTGDGVFRVPAEEMRVIDYYECLHDTMADAIEHFCRVTKEHWPRPVITAAFYGYFYSLFGRQAAGGHLAIERVLASPWIDCICAPQTYLREHREMGGTGQSRALQESARLHGKLVLDEMDQPPHTDATHVRDRDLTNRTEGESIAALRRNVFSSISRGMGMWYYDFGTRGGAGWWMRPSFMREIGELNALFAPRYHAGYEPAADVLVVYDAKTFLYTANNSAADPVTDNIALNQTATALYHSGAAFDTVYLFDLPRVDLKRYRAVVFVNTYIMDDKQRDFIRGAVAADGRHLVWFYAPGAVGKNGADAERISALTGIKVEHCEAVNPLVLELADELGGILDLRKRFTDLYFMFGDLDTGIPLRVSPVFAVTDGGAQALGHYGYSSHVAVAKKSMDGWTSWYCGMPLAGPAALRAVFRQAGAHIYTDSGDTILAGTGLVMLHAKEGGPREVTLRGGKKVSLYVPPASSIFFDAETGERLRG